MAAPKKVRTKAGTTRSTGSVQVPLNEQDVVASIDQLQDTVNALVVKLNSVITDLNAHTHGGVTVGAGVSAIKGSAAITAVDGTAAAAADLFTTPEST